jgi:predicted DNA-binding transcriptional regulator YafY
MVAKGVYHLTIHTQRNMKKLCRPQYCRIRRILEMIRDGTHSGRLPNAETFCSELDVSRPTVMRDIEWLRDEERAPIEYSPSAHGYRLSDATWELPALRLSRGEVFAFSIAGKLLSAFKGTPLDLDMASLFGKIEHSLEGSVTLDPAALTEHFTVLGDDYVKQDPETWSAVAAATDRRERLRMEYQKFDGAVKEYELEPYHLLAYHGNWYVIGGNLTGGKIATFAVSRIRALRRTGQFFEVPGDFDIQQHIADSFGIVRGEKVFRVRLLFAKNVATYIRERVWHPSQRIVDKRDGSVELTIETGGWNELVRWILSWQPDVKVLSPKRLRERVREKMREAVSNAELGTGNAEWGR